MGKTELIFSVMGHRFDDGPRVPMMYVGSSQKNVRSMSRDRISKMIRSTPTLYEKLHKGQEDGLYEKYLAGVRLGLAWPSANELASHPVGVVLIDELDRMDSNIDGEGDPVSIVSARTKNYDNSKIGIFSTPTIEGASAVYRWWSEGTKHRYCWKCPECGTWFAPEAQHLRWPGEGSPGERATQTILGAPCCGGIIKTGDREHLEAAYWPHIFDEAGRLQRVDEAPANSVASFWAHGLHSPFITFESVAEKLIRAYDSGSQDRIQGVLNTQLGEVYAMEGDAPDHDEVYRLNRSTYRAGEIPVGVQMLTLGVDVQKDRLEYALMGFGWASECWKIQSGQLFGQTEYDDVWIKLTNLWQRTWAGLPIERVFVDSGYRPGLKFQRPEHKVYDYCRQFSEVYPTKGRDKMEKVAQLATVDIHQDGSPLKVGVQLAHINTNYWKTWVYDRIRMDPVKFHLDADTTMDFCKQLCSESLVELSSGKLVWKVDYRENHGLDCVVLAAAAAWSCGMYELPTWEEYTARQARPVDNSEPERLGVQGRDLFG